MCCKWRKGTEPDPQQRSPYSSLSKLSSTDRVRLLFSLSHEPTCLLEVFLMDASSAFEPWNAYRLFLHLPAGENSRLRLASASSTAAPTPTRSMQLRNSYANGIRSDSQRSADGNATGCERTPFPRILDWSWKVGAANGPSLTRKKRCMEVETEVEGGSHTRDFYGCRSVDGDTVSTNSRGEERNTGMLLCPTFEWNES